MYFYKQKGKQILDLTGDVVITHNDNPVKTRNRSAAPAGIKGGKVINLHNVKFFRKLYISIYLAVFVWRSKQELTPDKTALNKPVVKPKCPVIEKHCKHYSYQRDSNDEIAIEFCGHPENANQKEGNCTRRLCPYTYKQPSNVYQPIYGELKNPPKKL